MSIHDIEKNIKQADQNTYIDQNFENTQFQMIGQATRSVEPWASFWHDKAIVNQKLLRAVTEGRKDEVQRLLNPLA